MARDPTSAADIAGWDSSGAVAASLADLGLEPRGDSTPAPAFDIGDERLFLALGPDATVPTTLSPGDNVLTTTDFQRFVFSTPRTADAHGRESRRRFAFERQTATDDSYAAAVHERLRQLPAPDADPVDTLYDDGPVLAAFHDAWTELREELAAGVSGIPAERAAARRRFVGSRFGTLLFCRFLECAGAIDDGWRRRVSEGGATAVADATATFLGDPFGRPAVEREYPDARLGADEDGRMAVDGMLALLDDWSWTLDERAAVEPRTLSPAVLGHVFERSVERKERGAFYTPSTVTGFMARRAVRPWLLDRVADDTGDTPESVDAVVGPAADDRNTGTVEALFHAALDCRVLDPAVGSGAFLLAAGEVLVDVLLASLDRLRGVVASGHEGALSDRTLGELERFGAVAPGATRPLRRHVAGSLLHGVDTDGGATAVCRRRLLLWVLAGGAGSPTPLPDLATTVRRGNALVGVTALPPAADASGADATPDSQALPDQPVADLAEAVERVRNADEPVAATAARESFATALADRTAPLDRRLRKELSGATDHDVGEEDVAWLDPFHWPLEFPVAHGDGGFDVVLGNPPWDVVKADRDRFFPAFDPGFRSRPPVEKDARQAGLLEDPDIAARWDRFRRRKRLQADYFAASDDYRRQSPTVAGRAVGSEHDLSMLFTERVLALAGSESRVGLLLPGNLALGASAKDLRTHLLASTTVDHLVGVENGGLIPGLHSQYRFCLVAFRNAGSTASLRGGYGEGDTRVLRRFDERAVDVPAELLASYSPAARTFPFLRSQRQVDLLTALVAAPSLSDPVEDAWFAEPYTELHRAQDTDRFDAEGGDYPVYGGRNVYQFVHDDTVFDDIDAPSLWSVAEDRDPERSAKRRIRERAFNGHDPRFSPKPAVYEAFGGTGSQRAFVDDLLESHRGEPLSLDDVRLDCTAYRIVYREIANATNERGLVAAVVPPGVVCHHKLHTVRPYVVRPTEADLSAPSLRAAYERVFTDRELFAAVGLLNSLPFDYLLRSKLDTSVVMYKFRESQVPRLTAGDPWFDPIASRAARLNCYGEAFAPMRDRLGGVEPVTDTTERRRVQTELEAAACHAYGLDREQVEFLLDDFHTVERPRLVDDDYLDAVARAFDGLATDGPGADLP